MESTESGGSWEDKQSATELGMRLLVTDFKATCSCLRGIGRESLHSFQEYMISSLTLAFSVSGCSPPFILRWECISVTFTASWQVSLKIKADGDMDSINGNSQRQNQLSGCLLRFLLWACWRLATAKLQVASPGVLLLTLHTTALKHQCML